MSEEGEGEALCTRDVDASRLVLSSARRGTRTARETCTDYTRIYQDCIYQDMPGYARICQRGCTSYSSET